MSVLQALAGHYDRILSNGEAPPFGFSRERISYVIVLSQEGKIVDVMPLLDTSGRKPEPRSMVVPQSFKRPGTAPRSFFLWDKTSYALGVKRDSGTKRLIPAQREHTAFKELHENMLTGTEDEGLRAFLAFLNEWLPKFYDTLPHSEDMLDTNVVFRLDGKQNLLHGRPVAKTIWLNHLAEQDGAEGLCLVTGKRAPIERLHPAVKGVWGAQSSGASIVSFNLTSFGSFNKKQGANAPVSKHAAFAYTTALNTLLARDSRRRIQVGDSTAVFWAKAAGDESGAAAAEELFAIMANPPTDEEEAARVADKLQTIAAGRPLVDAEPNVREDTRFHVLGLAPNAARLSIRFWCVDSIGTIARRIAEHWSDLHLNPVPWKTPPSVSRLLWETAVQRKAENISPTLGGVLMRSILTGQRYPRSLLAAVVNRMRADKDINGLRVAICKACIARDHRLGFEEEDVPVNLKVDEINPAYRLGRLFAVYENIQRAALPGLNATIKDRYFGAASTTPASVFPLLIRTSTHHLSSLRKGDKGGLAHWFEREIDSILMDVDTSFPRSLRLEDQGRFALGYYHQRATARRAAAAADDASDPDLRNAE